MNEKSHFFNAIVWKFLLTVLISSLSLIVIAKDFNFQINKIAQFNQAENENSLWLQLINNPSNIEQYFIINKKGEMFLVDGMEKLHPLLDLNVNNLKDSPQIEFTSFVLHPNFALRNQTGYSTFYTAHIEPLDDRKNIKRLQESSNELVLKFDTVITEWQFSSINHQKINLSTKREILRVAVPDESMMIKQMSFSPYSKSWDDDFGFLYIALSGEKKWNNPLYSGVLLRINPAKFGLRNYTVPQSNPFIKESGIKDEIYSLGAQSIKQFIWPEKNSDNILLFHYFNDEILLSLANAQSDWRGHFPKKTTHQGNNSIEDALLYRGSNLSSIRNKLLLLSKYEQVWSVRLLNINPSNNDNLPVVDQPQQEWQFTLGQLPNNNEMIFSQNRNGEVLILDKTAGMLFQISQENLSQNSPNKVEVVSAKSTEEPASSVYFFLIILIIIGAFLYFLKRKNHSAKAIVRKQYAQIELSDSKQKINFYHRHQKSSDTTIDLMRIITCEIRLNDNIVSIINKETGNGFDHDKEKDLRAIFAKEKAEKMVDGKIRQINLSITDTDNKHYVICLYMRKGSDRVTKKSYSIAIEDLIDWCWIIAEKINPNDTKKRKKKIKKAAESNNDSAAQRRNSILHNQVSETRPSNHSLTEKEQPVPKVIAQKNAILKNAQEVKGSAEPLKQSGNINTDLVYALEKLVDLKQQGFLTQEEFNKAKENLLNSLYS